MDPTTETPEPDFFEVRVELGSEAMQTPRAVAEKLEEIAAYLLRSPGDEFDSHPIKDENGNTIGHWRVVAL
jgi:hypothetical protein